MKIWRDFSEIPQAKTSLVATIGNFDGLHLGHLFLLTKLKKKALESGSETLVITYANSPLSVLRPDVEEKHLILLEQKIQLLSDFGIDNLLLITFTKAFAEKGYEEFLSDLLEKLPIKQFVFGYDTAFGQNKSGTQDKVLSFLKQKLLDAVYCEPFLIEGKTVSSRNIRELLSLGDLSEVEKLLGRPFTISGKVLKGAGRGRTLGFPTANLSVENLCTPPLGVYLVKVEIADKSLYGVANLGVRPTFEKSNRPILEVHLFDFHGGELYGQKIQVQLLKFLRPEKKFESKEALLAQIESDVASAKHHLASC